MIFYDTETCGFHGLAVLIQYAEDNGPVKLYNVFQKPIQETLDLIEYFMDQEVVGFNLAFDHFHLCKLYTILSLVDDKTTLPEEIIPELALLEPHGRRGLCLKPKASCDLMLIAQTGKYQSLMRRKPIIIKNVPARITPYLHQLLEESTNIPDIYFAKRARRDGPRWKVLKSDKGPQFDNIVLVFQPSTSLKALTEHALGNEFITFDEITVNKEFFPYEKGWAPFAAAFPREKTWVAKLGLTHIIEHHTSRWYFNKEARRYAELDVENTRLLYEHLGNPDPGDDNSELACMVGAVRWKGYKINKAKILALKEESEQKIQDVPTAPEQVKKYFAQDAGDDECDIIKETTKRVVLEEISTSELWEDSPFQEKAKKVLEARQHKWRLDLLNKLLIAGRFHASFKVVGALSSRMSGADDLNAQGIAHDPNLRELFVLADDDMVLCGGDFDAFEVSLAEAEYKDPELRKDLLAGKKVHGIFATYIYPDMTYDEILKDKERYGRGKSGFFSLIYGGDYHTLVNRLNVEVERAQEIYNNFTQKYKKVEESRQEVFDQFCTMVQDTPGGKVTWRDPDNVVTSMLGHSRSFVLENKICKILYDIANKPPKHWKKLPGKVIRNLEKGEQTLCGATQSALFLAAFNIQSQNMRAAANHRIQTPGAQICKRVERRIWDIQPSGVTPWIVQPMNIHDEIECPVHPDYVDVVKDRVQETVETFKDKVPLLNMSWKVGLESWAEK